MLALLYPRRDVMAARWELEHGDARAKASACEYLDNVLSGPLRRRLMPMLEELTDEERVTKGNVILRTRPRDVEETLLILINSDDEVVSAAAIDLVGRLELRSLADDLDHVLAHRDVRDWHVFEAASWTLAGLRLQASKRRALWLEPLPSVEIASRLRSIPLFASVATDELFRIARTGRQVRLDRGHTLYEAGALPSHVHLLLDGQVRATAPGGEARDVPHPAPLGLEEVLEERAHAETVRAVETSVALQLTVEEARGLLADNTDLVQGLFRWMLDHPAFGTGRLVVRGTSAASGDGAAPLLDPATPVRRRDDRGAAADRRRPGAAARSAVRAQLGRGAAGTGGDRARGAAGAGRRPAARLRRAGHPPGRSTASSKPATMTGETVAIAPGDTLGVLETCAGVPIGANIRVTAAGRALRISHEDFFDLLGQRADLLQSLFATLFGARRAEWDLAAGDTSRPAAARELV